MPPSDDQDSARGPAYLLVLALLGAASGYAGGWFLLASISQPGFWQQWLYPLVPGGLIFLHFYVRWYSPVQKNALES